LLRHDNGLIVIDRLLIQRRLMSLWQLGWNFNQVERVEFSKKKRKENSFRTVLKLIGKKKKGKRKRKIIRKGNAI